MRANAARAAFAPPRRAPRHRVGRRARENSRSTGVSARPNPGTGRNTSCWWIAAVPELIDPPTSARLRSSRSPGPCAKRPRTRSRNPGACCSISCSTRSARRRVRSGDHDSPRGTCV
ncbi:hypothetical protein K7G98_22510 [Saccharothrix sp. MB29]|nr:hypothetical protein [Saccharothrix sp. MB29]